MECGFAAGSEVEVRVKRGLGAYPAQVKTCGSVWVCAVCAAKVKARRSVEVEAGAVAWTLMHGGSLSMVTLTVRHYEWMQLRRVLEAVAGGWRKLRNRREYRVLRPLLGGTVKSLEVTVGRNGWHVHIHVLLFVSAGVDRSSLVAAAHALFDPWAEMAESALGVAPDRRHGVHVRWLDATAAEYVAKIGDEMTKADMKEGATVHPFVLLDQFDLGDFDAGEKFVEYGNGLFGRHSLDWSPGLRKSLGLSAERSDEELAAVVEDGEVVEFIDGRVWNRAHIARDANGIPQTAAYLRKVESEWLAS